MDEEDAAAALAKEERSMSPLEEEHSSSDCEFLDEMHKNIRYRWEWMRWYNMKRMSNSSEESEAEDEEDDEQEDEMSMVQFEVNEDEDPCSVKEGGTRGEKT